MLKIPMALFEQLPVGTKITGNIGVHQDITGRLSKDGEYWCFCQNRVDGKEIPDTLGYHYSYVFKVSNYDGYAHIHGNVEIDSITFDGTEPMPMQISGYGIGFFDNYIMFGGTKIKHTTIAKIAEAVKSFKK